MQNSCQRSPASLNLARDGTTFHRVAEPLGVVVLGAIAGTEVAAEVAEASHHGGEQR